MQARECPEVYKPYLTGFYPAAFKCSEAMGKEWDLDFNFPQKMETLNEKLLEFENVSFGTPNDRQKNKKMDDSNWNWEEKRVLFCMLQHIYNKIGRDNIVTSIVSPLAGDRTRPHNSIILTFAII